MLQKSRGFFYTPHIATCCQQLALLNQYPTDKYLAYIVHFQMLIEKVDDIVGKPSVADDVLHFHVESRHIAQQCIEAKSALPFPLGDSREFSQHGHILTAFLT